MKTNFHNIQTVYIYDANYRKIVNKTAQTCENNELINAFSQ
jgi:hypothetical protein